MKLLQASEHNITYNSDNDTNEIKRAQYHSDSKSFGLSFAVDNDLFLIKNPKITTALPIKRLRALVSFEYDLDTFKMYYNNKELLDNKTLGYYGINKPVMINIKKSKKGWALWNSKEELTNDNKNDELHIYHEMVRDIDRCEWKYEMDRDNNRCESKYHDAKSS